MRNERRTRTKGALAAAAAAAVIAGAAWWSAAKAQENYITVGGGVTLAGDYKKGPIKVDGETGWTGNIAYGQRVNERMRAEAELSYLTIEGEGDLAGEGFDLEGEGLAITTNAVFDLGPDESEWGIEGGLGLGWMFGGDACAKVEGVKYCADIDDDWTIQGIVGATLDVTEHGTLVARYRLQHAGGFGEEERMHVFTIGYRTRF